MQVPENLKYSNDHEWIRIDGNVAYVGITAYAAEQLGDIVFIDVPSVGETLAKEEVFGSVEAVKTVSDLLLPIGGEVIEFNEKLVNEPALVNSNPYDEGWIIKINPADASEINSLLDAAAYSALIGA
ncbi:MAG: glycine cleavage system protein GcvH [Bacteroidales bacterium]|jgi:glycine cleavage system H protein|nr:glycine cleavage system protein GcvH [Bacteroidales bacterium]